MYDLIIDRSLYRSFLLKKKQKNGEINIIKNGRKNIKQTFLILNKFLNHMDIMQ